MSALNSVTSKSLFPTLYPSHLHAHSQSPHVGIPNSVRFSTLHFSGEKERRKKRGISVVTNAGPSNNQLIFAFVFPISLLAVTVFTAFRIGDRLDQKFLEELAMDEAIREAEEENDDDDGAELVIPRKEEPALSRARNRPKREV